MARRLVRRLSTLDSGTAQRACKVCIYVYVHNIHMYIYNMYIWAHG